MDVDVYKQQKRGLPRIIFTLCQSTEFHPHEMPTVLIDSLPSSPEAFKVLGERISPTPSTLTSVSGLINQVLNVADLLLTFLSPCLPLSTSTIKHPIEIKYRVTSC